MTNYQAFAKDSPTNWEVQAELADLYQQQARIYLQRAPIDLQQAERFSGKERDEWLEKSTNETRVATNALLASCDMLNRLASLFPKSSRYRNSLADGYTLLAENSPEKDANRMLQLALVLRKALVAETPDNPKYLESLADLFANIADSSTNPAEILLNTQSELPYRKKLSARTGQDSGSLSNSFFKLAMAYGRLADISGDNERSIAITQMPSSRLPRIGATFYRSPTPRIHRKGIWTRLWP